MGPAILLDKSAFQKCPKVLLPEMYRHYSLDVPPILVKEILEDYGETAHKFFGLARRFDLFEITMNVDYVRLYEHELLGTPVPMEGRPSLVVGRVINSEEGLIHILKESAESKALRRWKDGIISESEKKTAANWYAATENFDMEAVKAHLRKHSEGLPKFSRDSQRAIREVGLFVDRLLSLPEQQQFLELALLEFPAEFRQRVRDRWTAMERPALKVFTPFVHFCQKVRFVFALALSRDLISSHHNSVLDLEYLYYLPFCQIFCSDDKKLHNVMQSVLLRPDQVFWDYSTFERALGETQIFFRDMTPDQMRKWFEKNGHYPPKGPSITRQMYERFWNLPPELQQNFAKKLPQEVVNSVIRKIKAARSQM